ncbi:MAG: adenine deaminase C-terminal domain-containing protein [Dehalococcoidia bacterium]|nr:adenine deaminase C-terminal domain-containing protein [Dehalococcoidia bacterium]
MKTVQEVERAGLEPSLEEAQALIQVAQGLRPAHIYIANGQIVNVYSGEILPANIAVYGGRIAYVGTQERMVGKDTQVIDATGYYLVPGYLDAHCHSDLVYLPHNFMAKALTTGLTACFSDSFYFSSIFQAEDFLRLVDDLSALPVKFFTAVRAETQAYPMLEETELYDLETLGRILDHPRVLGITEVTCWLLALDADPLLLQKLHLSRSKGKKVEGHTPGATYDQLNALVCAGLTDCHEPITAQQVLDRLRLGLWVPLRHGSIRQDMEQLAKAVTENHACTSRLMLTPDSLYAMDLVRLGYMDYTVKEAIRCGLDPVTVIQMATINPATYLGLDGVLGGIAPRRYADILFIRDLREPTPERVMASGRLVAEKGELLVEFPTIQFAERARNRSLETLRTFGRVGPEIFCIPAQGKEVEFPVIEMVNLVVNRRADYRLPVVDGYIRCDPSRDILKVALLDGKGGRVTNAFLSGYGARIGALASSNNILREVMVIGSDEEDMAVAVNRVMELGGALVIVEQGKVEFELPLPVAGILSPEPVEAIARRMEEMMAYIKKRDFRHSDPHIIMDFLCLASLPTLRLSTAGLYNAREQRIVYPSQKVVV